MVLLIKFYSSNKKPKNSTCSFATMKKVQKNRENITHASIWQTEEK